MSHTSTSETMSGSKDGRRVLVVAAGKSCGGEAGHSPCHVGFGGGSGKCARGRRWSILCSAGNVVTKRARVCVITNYPANSFLNTDSKQCAQKFQQTNFLLFDQYMSTHAVRSVGHMYVKASTFDVF